MSGDSQHHSLANVYHAKTAQDRTNTVKTPARPLDFLLAIVVDLNADSIVRQKNVNHRCPSILALFALVLGAPS